MRLPTPLLRRDANAHKNHFGHVLVVAGSSRMLGAAALSTLAVMRSGAGLVTLAVAKSLNLTAQAKISPVVMTLPLAETSPGLMSAQSYQQIKKLYPKLQAIAVGPGLDLDSSVKKVVFALVKECPLPLVVDAAALTLLSQDVSILKQAKGPRILTPDVGEMQLLTGLSGAAIEGDRQGSACAFSRQYNCVLVLKGPGTVVASPDGKSYINRTGNAGMATAGSGDVLTGIIAALVAQGIESFEAAQIGCYIHGQAGDLAAKQHGMLSLIASDLVTFIPQAFNKRIK
jgi:hydroxyethylthiazole kinase-like uncharacterized protein yjeF